MNKLNPALFIFIIILQAFRMNPADISQIMPVEQDPSHFIDIKSQNQVNEIYLSKTFSTLFYKRKNMRELLDERTQLCISLNLSSARKPSSNLNKQQLSNHFCALFEDGPSKLNDFSWTIIEDRGTVYAFLATDQKYVPQCKLCNATVYISLRGDDGRVSCSNGKCKIKVLGEFQIGIRNEKVKTQNRSNHSRQQSKKVRQELKLEQDSHDIGLNQRNQIKRAVKRIVE